MLGEGAHTPLLIVHLNMLGPYPKPVTPEAGLFGVVIVPVPLTSVHRPVPTVGVFPANVVLVISHRFWLAPALDVVGVCQNVTWASVLDVHAPDVIVHLRT